MQRPPIFLTRPATDWIHRVGQKHNQVQSLSLSAQQREELTAWLETEFVFTSLSLDGQSVSREQVALTGIALDQGRELAESDRLIAAQRAALRLAQSHVSDQPDEELITPQLLLKLNHPLADAALFRTRPVTATHSIKPPLPEHVTSSVQSACYWFTAESFLELNPLEQAAIVYLRLLEVQPYDKGNVRTGLVAASLFTLRKALPPIIIPAADHAQYAAALDASRQSNTQPMVEFLARATETTLDAMIGVIRSNP